VVAAAVGLIAAVPLALVVASAVGMCLGRPVFFFQVRAGRNGRPFTMIKFRSMRAPCDRGHPESDADRLTRFGYWLRASSLDEIPELVNILLGHMSFVGPRPLPVDYLSRYDAAQARRHEVRPGLTGLAQIRGRNDLKWDDRLRSDVEYVDTWSLHGDLLILWRTAAVVISRRGVSTQGLATTSEFHGSTEETSSVQSP
jgi:lipopolysaccharide/colanic/teichoic acid biosynthesis glycosyltransferase